MQRILTSIGAGRLIGVSLITAIVVGAVIAVPLLVAADDRPSGTTDQMRDTSVFQQGLNQLRIDGFFERGTETRGTLTFEFKSGIGRGVDLESNVLETVSELTGAEVEDVVDALADGQTLVEFAESHGVSEDTLLDALMEEIEAEIQATVENGDMSEDQAERFRLESRVHLQALINGDWPLGGLGFGRMDPPGGFPFLRFYDHNFGVELNPLEVAADLTDSSVDEVAAALHDGQTLAEYAEERGVSEAALVEAVMAAANDRAVEAVEEGDLTQEAADDLLATIEEHVQAMVNGEGFGFGYFEGFGNDHHFGPFGGMFGPGGCNEDGDEEGESTSSQI